MNEEEVRKGQRYKRTYLQNRLTDLENELAVAREKDGERIGSLGLTCAHCYI